MKNFVLAGLTGVGKSSFVNSAFGGQLAATNRYEACTKVVDHYAHTTEYGEVCLIDTPGLAEDGGVHDETYLGMVRDRLSGVAVEAFVYVTPLKETRFRAEEMDALTQITRHLGRRIWSSSWLVLTFAASLTDAERAEAVGHRHRHIDALLTRIAHAPGFLGGYNGFRNVLLVDNKVAQWSPACAPLASFLG